MASKMSARQFEEFVATKRLSGDMAEALEAHFVRGLTVSAACQLTGVTRSGFYSAVHSGSGGPGLVEVRVWVPEGRAQTLRERVQWQLDTWQREDEAALASGGTPV